MSILYGIIGLAYTRGTQEWKGKREQGSACTKYVSEINEQPDCK